MENLVVTQNNEDPRSFNTESEYSIISRPPVGIGNSLSSNPYLQPSHQALTDQFFERQHSPLNNNSTSESEHLSMSHYALATAYDHLKDKYKDLELKNRSLQRRIAGPKLGGNGMLTTSGMNHTQENNLTEAWEAYTDKSRECEKLRDELRVMEQKLTKSQIAAKDQSLRDDVLRAQSLHEELRKQLQQAELDANDLKHKEELAKEELEKEKEYHETVLRAAEQRHHQMESTIAELQKSLQDKSRKIQDLLKDQEKQKKVTQELMEQQEEVYKKKITELEGKVIKEQEERVKLAEEINTYQNFHLSTGIPLSMSQFHQQRLEESERDSDSNSNASDVDADELMVELNSLTQEITSLKRQALQQSSMLSRICEDPRVLESLNSFDFSTFTPMEVPTMNGGSPVSMPVQCTENEINRMGTASTDPSIDHRQIVDEMTNSAFDSSRSSNDNMFIPQNTRFAISRHIHAIRDPVPAHNTPPSVKIEIPRDPENLESAFNNLRMAKPAVPSDNGLLHPVNHVDEQDAHSSYYSAVPAPERATANSEDTNPKMPLSRRLSSEPGSSSLDSQNSANETTIMIPIGALERQYAGSSPDEPLVVRYPPPTSFAGDAKQGMTSKWPKINKKPSTVTSSALWPPGTSAASSRFSPSFDVITGQPTTSSYDVASQGDVDTGVGGDVKEFEVQPVRKSRDSLRTDPEGSIPQLPASHPTNRPTSRARNERSSLSNQPHSSDVTPSGHRLRHASSGSIEVLAEEDRTFVSGEIPNGPACPVCGYLFNSDTSESFMQRHINAHFSDEEVDEYNFVPN